MPKLCKELPTEERPEIIIIKEGIVPSLIKDAGVFAMFSGLIGLGVTLDSAALQWTGALVGFVVIINRAKRMIHDDRLTISEARRRLAEIEGIRDFYKEPEGKS